MKAEHRKELQTNALANRMSRFFQGLKTRTQATSIMIWVVVLLVVVVIGAFIIFQARAKNNRSQRLVEIDQAINDEQPQPTGMQAIFSRGKQKDAEKDLEDLIKKYPGTEAALIARFQLAQLHLRIMGLDKLADDNSNPMKNIKKGAQEYEDLAEDPDCKGDPYWEPQALMGIAKATEAQSVEDIKNLRKAVQLYTELADKYPDSAQGKEAKAIVKDLESHREQTEKFYEDLGKRLNLYNPRK